VQDYEMTGVYEDLSCARAIGTRHRVRDRTVGFLSAKGFRAVGSFAILKLPMQASGGAMETMDCRSGIPATIMLGKVKGSGWDILFT